MDSTLLFNEPALVVIVMMKTDITQVKEIVELDIKVVAKLNYVKGYIV